MKELFIFDISAIIHRCYHAVSELTTTKGVPVNAVYGTCSTLSRIFQQFQPKHAFVAWDTEGAGYRHSIYPEYKANRKGKDEELAIQYPYVGMLIKSLGINSLFYEGYEADDVIATLVQRYKEDYKCIIVSGDKDLCALVDKNVYLYDFGNDKMMGEDDVFTKFGVRPSQMTDYLALMGDSSDNIPGVKGVGKKKAADLIATHISMNQVYTQIESFKGKLKENLIECKDMAYLSRELVELQILEDLPTPAYTDGPVVNAPALDDYFAAIDFREPRTRFPGLYMIPLGEMEGQVSF